MHHDFFSCRAAGAQHNSMYIKICIKTGLFGHGILAWERGVEMFRVHLSQKKCSSNIPGNVSVNKNHTRPHPFQEQTVHMRQGIQNDIPFVLGAEGLKNVK